MLITEWITFQYIGLVGRAFRIFSTKNIFVKV